MAYRARVRRRGIGALNCPGDPGCPGGGAPSSSPDVQQQIADLWDSIFSMQTTPAVPVSVGGGTFTDWLNANGKTVALVGGGIFAMLLLSRGLR